VTVLLHAGYSVVVSDDDGEVRSLGREGVYDFDTRLLSRFGYAIGESPLELVASALVAPHRWRARLTTPSPARSADITGPTLPQDALELVVDRAVGPGLIDRLEIANRSAGRVAITLRVEAKPDFADVQEIGGERRQHGRIMRANRGGEVAWHYQANNDGKAIERGVKVHVDDADARTTESGIAIALDLAPHESAHATVIIESLVDDHWRTPDPEAHDRRLERWDASRTHVDSPRSEVCEAVDRAAADLGALRNDDIFGGTDEAWFPNAGVPVFTGFFGRDTLTAGWQAALLGPELLRGAIEVAARTQATDDDAWRDAEPGKLVHEIRRGPLAVLDIIPQSAYYGTQTTSSMFVLALSEYWHWTSDTAFLRRHLDTALRTFDWANRYGDRDGDGFLEYERRSSAGLKNQGWKDSDEAIRYDDGSVVDDPIATVEEQAFHHLALERMAEILVALGDDDRADEFLARARRLRTAWNDAFWLGNEQFYALALDPHKRAVRSITSNPGHALAAGLVPHERAQTVADRLMTPDLFSGWGIRTLSTTHPSYNPFAYHLGTVWPVEQATFALGFKRHGLDDHVDRLVEATLAAATASPGSRLPELIAGIPRSEFPHPVAYPGANAPQAWSASATIQLLQVTLGIYPFAPLGVLALVRPRLPSSIPEVTIRDLRVGRASVTLRFTRRPDGSAAHDIVERRGRLAIIEAGPPGAEDDISWRERLERLAVQRLPGRRARAARIALGLATPL
jgi:glycogen debranching enzyme